MGLPIGGQAICRPPIRPIFDYFLYNKTKFTRTLGVYYTVLSRPGIYNSCLEREHISLTILVPCLRISSIPLSTIVRPYLTVSELTSPTAMPEIVGQKIGPIGYGLMGMSIPCLNHQSRLLILP